MCEIFTSAAASLGCLHCRKNATRPRQMFSSEITLHQDDLLNETQLHRLALHQSHM